MTTLIGRFTSLLAQFPVISRTSAKAYSWKSEMNKSKSILWTSKVLVMGSIYVVKYCSFVENLQVQKSDRVGFAQTALASMWLLPAHPIYSRSFVQPAWGFVQQGSREHQKRSNMKFLFRGLWVLLGCTPSAAVSHFLVFWQVPRRPFFVYFSRC